MRTDAEVNMHRIWRETLNRLESYADRVRENRDVMAAVEFARFVLWSGIIRLCEANAAPDPLKVDGSFLRWKCEELERACTERFRLNDSSPHVEALQLQSIHQKLDLMAGYLSKLTRPGDAGAVPDLKVISGGLDGNVPAAGVGGNIAEAYSTKAEVGS